MHPVNDQPGLGFDRGEKPSPPERVLVFGASGQLGGPLAARILGRDDPPALRLVTSAADKMDGMSERFPGAEIVVASFYDLHSLLDAFEGMQAVFIVAPDFRTDERRAMTNLAAAAHHSGSVSHLLRLTASAPGRHRVADLLPHVRDVNGPARQFQEAREVLMASGVPVSFLNVYAYLMSDFLSLWVVPLIMRQAFASPYDRVTTFVDPVDVGEAAAALLLAGHDRHHDGLWYTVTGSERLRFSEVAGILSDELGMPISYEDDPETFYEETAPWAEQMGAEKDYGLRFLQAEYREEPTFVVTDTLPALLGRPAKTLREWIAEHRADLRGETELAQGVRAAVAAMQGA